MGPCFCGWVWMAVLVVECLTIVEHGLSVPSYGQCVLSKRGLYKARDTGNPIYIFQYLDLSPAGYT